MSKIEYVPKRFRASTLMVINNANAIIEEYQDAGYDLTLRQIYYQFIAKDLFPDDRRWRWTGRRWVRDADGTKNAVPNYKWLVKIGSDARLAGLIDWEVLVDRTRNIQGNPHWENPQEIIESCANQFRLDTRETQDNYLEVWVEKDALIGVLKSICVELDVVYFSCRGYVSLSAMWRAAQRIKNKPNPVILHLGDHDPSGIDMTRDIQDRLNLFGCHIEIKRIALNMNQIEKHLPPPSPAKTTDSRYDFYADKYGDDSWELDALDPRTITNLIREEVGEYTDEDAREELLTEQAQHRQDLQSAANNWETLI